MINRKSQIGTTLSWFFAFIIIFFIMMLFISFSIILGGTKEIPLIGKGKGEVSIEEFNPDVLESQRVLNSFLNSKLEINNKEKKLADWLFDLNENSEEAVKQYTYDFFKKSNIKMKIRTDSKTIYSKMVYLERLECYSGKYELNLIRKINEKEIKINALACKGRFITRDIGASL